MTRPVSLKWLPPLVLLSLFACLPALGGEPAPNPRVNRGPEYSLPPDELTPVKVYTAAEVPQDVVPWWAAQTGITECWNKGADGKGVTIAVLDTGIDTTHPALKGSIVGAFDLTGSMSGPSDVNGHGTHCAGIVHVLAPEAKLLGVKVLGDQGSGYDDTIGKGIDLAVSKGAHVLSLSLGSPQPGQFSKAAIDRALAAGVVVICAAGNEGPANNTIGYPGAYPGVICVAAVDAQDTVAGFSSRGPRLDVSSYGVSIRSTYPGGRYATMSGTSMACPNVAGAVACLLSQRKRTPAEMVKALQETAKDLSIPGRDTATGFGLIQPAKLLGDPAVPQPMPRGFVLGWDDLTEAARGRLKGQGVDSLKLEVTLKP